MPCACLCHPPRVPYPRQDCHRPAVDLLPTRITCQPTTAHPTQACLPLLCACMCGQQQAGALGWLPYLPTPGQGDLGQGEADRGGRMEEGEGGACKVVPITLLPTERSFPGHREPPAHCPTHTHPLPPALPPITPCHACPCLPPVLVAGCGTPCPPHAAWDCGQDRDRQ